MHAIFLISVESVNSIRNKVRVCDKEARYAETTGFGSRLLCGGTEQFSA
jgi:hypothetical protein